MYSLKRILGNCLLVFSLALFAFIPKALAVATLEVTVTDGSNAVSGETISLFNASGQQVEDDDNDGGPLIYKGLEPGLYTVKSGDKTLRTVSIGPNDTVKKISVTAPAYALRSPNWPNWPNSDLNLSYGVRGLYKYGSFDSRLMSPGFGNPSGDSNIGTLGIGFDLIMSPRTLSDLFFIASLGVLPSASDKSAQGDLHPTPGRDSYLKLREYYFLRALIGWTMYEMQRVSIAAVGGVQLTRRELSLVTDESGGGGNREKFNDKETSIDPVVGIMGSMKTNLANDARIYFGVNATRMGSQSVSGRSSLNFDYRGKVDSGWQSEVYFGLLFPF